MSALLARLRSPTGRRAAWSLADQALSSLTNFALAVFVARTVTPSEFGAFGLVFAAYLIMLNLTRALGTQPLLIRFSAAETHVQRAEIPGTTGSSLVVGIASAIVVAVIALIAGGRPGIALLALAITVPGLLLQDAWRMVFFALSRPASAALNDGIWAIAQVILFAVFYASGVRTVPPFVLAWGIAACAAAVAGVVQARAVPSLRAGVRWLITHRDIGPMLSLEFFATSATAQLTLFGVAAIAGLASVASLRAAQVALGPLTVITAGLLAVALPELTRVYRRDPDRMPRMAMLVGGLMAVSAVVVGVCVYFLPDSIGEAFLGDNWLPAHPVIIPSALGLAFSGLMTGPFLQMRVVAAVKVTLALTTTFMVIGVASATVGAVFWDAKGVAWGLAIASGVFALLAWLQARRVLADPAYRSNPVS